MPVARIPYLIFFSALFFSPALIARFDSVDGDEKFEDLAFDKHFIFSEVEPGEFIMGSSEGERKRFGDHWPGETPHRVKITYRFQIGKYDVTQSLFEKVMGSNPSAIKNPDSPVTRVSWNMAQAFLEKLKTVRKGDGYAYRLPTEAEWEYAARGGHKVSAEQLQMPFSFGDNEKNLPDYAVMFTIDGPEPVGTKKANPLGLFDIYGNVEQLTQDFYRTDYENLPFENPVSLTEIFPLSGRVVRGGSWFHREPLYFRSAMRNRRMPDEASELVGFRLVRTLLTSSKKLK